MAQDFFRKFVTDLSDADTTIAADGESAAEFTGFLDSGSYMLNAALSGSLFGGFPNNKALVLAGDPATGKTFFALSIVKSFLDRDDKGRVFYFDTESAVTNEMMEARGIDTTRVAKSEPASIEKFRSLTLRLLDEYEKIPQAERFPLLIVLDSLSMLPSNKEITDITDGKDTKDMTKPGIIRGTFRVLRLKMAKVQVPMIITSHTYAVIGSYVPMKDMSGGGGTKYAADTIVFLSKAKERNDEKELVGSIITTTMHKSRLTKEGTKVPTRVMFDGGLDRYYGLLDCAVESGVVEKVGNKYRFPGSPSTFFEKAILKTPEKFFTPELIQSLEAYVQKTYKYSATTLAEAAEEAADE